MTIISKEDVSRTVFSFSSSTKTKLTNKKIDEKKLMNSIERRR